MVSQVIYNRIVPKVLFEILSILGMIQTEGHCLLGYAKDVAKDNIGPSNIDLPGTKKATLYHQEMPLRTSPGKLPTQTSKPRKVHSYPVTVEDQHSQDE